MLQRFNFCYPQQRAPQPATMPCVYRAPFAPTVSIRTSTWIRIFHLTVRHPIDSRLLVTLFPSECVHRLTQPVAMARFLYPANHRIERHAGLPPTNLFCKALRIVSAGVPLPQRLAVDSFKPQVRCIVRSRLGCNGLGSRGPGTCMKTSEKRMPRSKATPIVWAYVGKAR
jgi:hypothetical protein